jgi:hypothetical protein
MSERVTRAILKAPVKDQQTLMKIAALHKINGSQAEDSGELITVDLAPPRRFEKVPKSV